MFDCVHIDSSIRSEKSQKDGFVFLRLLTMWQLYCLEKLKEGRAKFPEEQEKLLLKNIEGKVRSLKSDLIKLDVEGLNYIGVALSDYKASEDVGFKKILVKSLLSSYKLMSEKILNLEIPNRIKQDENLETKWKELLGKWKVSIKEFNADETVLSLHLDVKHEFDHYLNVRRDVNSLYRIYSAIESFKEEGFLEDKKMALQGVFRVIGEYIKNTRETANLSDSVRKSLEEKGIPVSCLSEFRDLLSHSLLPVIYLDDNGVTRLYKEGLLPIKKTILKEIFKIESGFIKSIIQGKPEIEGRLVSYLDKEGFPGLIKYIESIDWSRGDYVHVTEETKELVEKVIKIAKRMRSSDFSLGGEGFSRVKQGEITLEISHTITQFVHKSKLEMYNEVKGKLESWRLEKHMGNLGAAHRDVVKIADVVSYLSYGRALSNGEVLNDFLSKTQVLKEIKPYKDNKRVPLKNQLEEYFDLEAFKGKRLYYGESIGAQVESLVELLKNVGGSSDNKNKLTKFLKSVSEYQDVDSNYVSPDEYKKLVGSLNIDDSENRKKLNSFSVDLKRVDSLIEALNHQGKNRSQLADSLRLLKKKIDKGGNIEVGTYQELLKGLDPNNFDEEKLLLSSAESLQSEQVKALVNSLNKVEKSVGVLTKFFESISSINDDAFINKNVEKITSKLDVNTKNEFHQVREEVLQAKNLFKLLTTINESASKLTKFLKSVSASKNIKDNYIPPNEYKKLVKGLNIDGQNQRRLLSFSIELEKVKNLIDLLKTTGESSENKSKLIKFFKSIIAGQDIDSNYIPPNEYEKLVKGLNIDGQNEKKFLLFSIEWRKNKFVDLLKKNPTGLKKIYDAIIEGKEISSKDFAYQYMVESQSIIEQRANNLNKIIIEKTEKLYSRRLKDEVVVLKGLQDPYAVSAEIINLYFLLWKQGVSQGQQYELQTLRNYLAHGDVLISDEEDRILLHQLVKSKDKVLRELGDNDITFDKVDNVIRVLESEISLSKIKKILCPNSLSKGRRRRSANNGCLTWEEIDKFSEGGAKNRDPDNIVIDSEKFIDAILSESGVNKEKVANLVALASESEVTGKYQDEVITLTDKQMYINHLEKVGKVSGMVMHGIIAKDIISDLFRGDYGDAVINLGFLAGNQGLGHVVEALSVKGAGYIVGGRVLLGKSLKFASPFLSRVTSAFIAYDLYNQVKEYNEGNKDALVPIIGDSIQLGADSIVLGVEIGEGLGLVAFEGLSSVAGPIGMAVGAVVLVGTQVYTVVRKVKQIDEQVHLTGWEKFAQGSLAFLAQDPSEYITKSIDEKEANNKAVKNAMDFLKDNPHIQRYVFSSMKAVTSTDHVIYERDLDHIYDGLNFMKVNRVLNSIVLLDQKRNDIKWVRTRPNDVSGVNLFCLPKGDWEPVPKSGTYYCDGAIGVERANNRTGNYTLINLGYGSDRAKGFQDSSNIFVLDERNKEMVGGNEDDNFVFQKKRPSIGYTIEITGSIDGSEGVDTVDVSQLPLNYNEYMGGGKYQVFADFRRGILRDASSIAINMSNIDQFLGRKDGVDEVLSACNTKHVDGKGGANKDYLDSIIIPRDDDCFYHTKVIVGPYTKVTNNATNGDFVYFVKGENGKESYIDLGPNSQSNDVFVFNYTLQDIANIDKSEGNTTFSFVKGLYKEGEKDVNNAFNLTVSSGYKNTTTYQLIDSTQIIVGQNNVYALQNTKKSIDSFIKDYSSIANRLKMYVVVHSDNEILTVAHSNQDVLTNDPNAKASHLVGGGGEGVFVVTSGHEKLTLAKLPVSDVIIYDFDADNKVDTLDLRKIREQLKKDLGLEFKTEISRVRSDLLINLFVDSDSKKEVLKVILKDALENNWYKRVHIVADTVFLVEGIHDNFRLTPQPLIFDDGSKNIYVISPDDVAKGNKIKVKKEIGEYVFARDNNTLFIMNSLGSNTDENKFCTVIFNDFYYESNKDKMCTLEVEFADKKILLMEKTERINSAHNFGELSEKIRIDGYGTIISSIREKRIFEAIEENNIDKVKEFIDHGASTNARNEKDLYGRKLIHFAASGGHKKIVELLTSRGVSVDERDNADWTPLHWAIFRGRLDMIKYLVTKGANIAAKTKGGKAPLGLAIDGKHNNVAEYLRQVQLDLDHELLNAVSTSNIDEVKHTIRRGADVNTRNYVGLTALHLAAQGGHLDIVEKLIEKGADLNAKDNDGWVPFYYAVDSGNLELVKYLVEKGADWNVKDGDGKTPLHLAAMYGHLEVVKYLKERGAAFNLKDHYEQSPLHSATINGKLEVVKYLVEEGANIDDKDKSGRTPLDFAVQKGHKDIVEFLKQKQSQSDLNSNLQGAINEGDLDIAESLVDRGADINVANESGQTILHSAAGSDEIELVRRLLEKGANINSVDAVMETPLHYAVAEGGDLGTVKLLVDKGANINAANIYDRTPLHLATILNRLDLVKHFVERGADFNLSDRYGDTPLSLATKKGYGDIIEYLEKKLNERKEIPKQRKRRHHRGDHSIRHLSRKPLSADLDSQPEIAISSGARPSSWIGDLFGWVNKGVERVKGLVSSWLTDNTADFKSGSEAKISTSEVVDTSGTILLLDMLIRKVTGQKHILSNIRDITLQEANGHAINITEGFEKIIKRAAQNSKISMSRFNVDFPKVQGDVTKKILSGRYSEILGVLNSYVKDVCNIGEVDGLSVEEFSRFMTTIDKGLSILLNQSMPRILNGKDNVLEVEEQQKNFKPRSDLSNVSVLGYTSQVRGLI